MLQWSCAVEMGLFFATLFKADDVFNLDQEKGGWGVRGHKKNHEL